MIIERKRCSQCWRFRALPSFIGARGKPVNMCNGCRTRYRNWGTKTVAERLAARRKVRHTGNGYNVYLALRSRNRKTGPIPVSMTDMKSCPNACPHKDAGCYAGYGKAAMHWKRVPTVGTAWKEFCAKVRTLKIGTLWRHNEAGDLPGLLDRLDTHALAMLVRSNNGKRGFTFTHKPLLDRDEQRAVRQANRNGFTINLSADSLREADRLADLRIAPVTVILPDNAPHRATKTPAGRTVVVCPAVTTEGMTCKQCRLCAVATRKAIVGFPAHGQASALVTLRVRGKL